MECAIVNRMISDNHLEEVTFKKAASTLVFASIKAFFMVNDTSQNHLRVMMGFVSLCIKVTGHQKKLAL